MKHLANAFTILLLVAAIVVIGSDAALRALIYFDAGSLSEAEAKCNEVKPGTDALRLDHGWLCMRNMPVHYIPDEVKP